MSDQNNLKDTVFLPTTDFPMRAGLPQKEPAILAKWQADDQYRQLRDARKDAPVQCELAVRPPALLPACAAVSAVDCSLSNVRTRAASLGGTSMTRSPAETNCWASNDPVPAAPSIAHVRGV